jgi:hypothetical protein
MMIPVPRSSDIRPGGLGGRVLRSSLLDALAYPHGLDRSVELVRAPLRPRQWVHVGRQGTQPMQLNYFGRVELILGLLRGMSERGTGQIANVGRLGAQTSARNTASAAGEFGVKRWAYWHLRQEAPRGGCGATTGEQQQWPI